MNKITCICRDQQTRVFFYESHYDDLDKEWLFLVYDRPESKDLRENGFELKYKVLEDGTWRQAGIHHHSLEKYSAKGIPDAMLPEISRLHDVTIVSSPTRGESGIGQEDVRRSDDATKMWKRLCSNGIAEYDQESDVFTLRKAHTP
jgi:hypothetical protein